MLKPMQKEDLLKRLRIFATVTTVVMVLLVVGLLIQFGLIAYHNTELTRLRQANTARQNQIAQLEKELEYYRSEDYIKDKWPELQNNG